MKKLFLLIVLAFSVFNAYSQADLDTSDYAIKKEPEEIFVYIEEMPKPLFDLRAYIQGNLIYPKQARKKDIQGRVVVKFVINEMGDVEDAKVITGIGGGCDEEALRVIKNMPKWKPGKHEGKTVKVWFTQSINFALTGPR